MKISLYVSYLNNNYFKHISVHFSYTRIINVRIRDIFNNFQ